MTPIVLTVVILMRRFAIIFNKIPDGRIAKIPFLKEEFDWIQFNPNDMDWETINEYEAVYFYAISGANKAIMGEHLAKYMPMYMRNKGVTKPKFIWQMDYFQAEPTAEWYYHDVMPYIDAITDCYDGWTVDQPDVHIPFYYVAYPLEMREEDKRMTND